MSYFRYKPGTKTEFDEVFGFVTKIYDAMLWYKRNADLFDKTQADLEMLREETVRLKKEINKLKEGN